jgi:hypothetical protein
MSANGRLDRNCFIAQLLVAMLLGGVTAVAAQNPSSPANKPAPAPAVSPSHGDNPAADPDRSDLPVSLDRIKEQLAHPPANQLKGLDERPVFSIEVQEKQKLEDLIASLDFKSGPTPAGGVRANEMQRVQFPSVDNPLRQPYAAFSQSELLTVLVENIVGKYLAGRAADSITSAERSRAENTAKEQVRQAITDYCAAQPDHGTNVRLCTTAP